MELNHRLKSVYELLPTGCTPIDVGTDHCYLPIYALQHGKIQKAFVSDLRQGPLQNGIKNAETYGFRQQIVPLLSDGLDKLDDDMRQQIDTFVFAGMGGILISEIIDRSAFLKDPAKTLILQPMTAVYELKEYLYAAGFTIEKEVLSREGQKIYLAFTARFCGTPETEVNPFVNLQKDPLFPTYITAQKARFLKQKSGLIRGGETDSDRYRAVLYRLQQIGDAEK